MIGKPSTESATTQRVDQGRSRFCATQRAVSPTKNSARPAVSHHHPAAAAGFQRWIPYAAARTAMSATPGPPRSRATWGLGHEQGHGGEHGEQRGEGGEAPEPHRKLGQ